MIEIVSHCYAARLDQYAAFLRYQISSLITYPADLPIRITVCCTIKDRATLDVILDLRRFHIPINVHLMGEGSLFRRSIGRNEIAKETQADLVWFTDVDHIFGSGCLADVWDKWDQLSAKIDNLALIYPLRSMICKDHLTGDAYVERARGRRGRLLFDPDDFIEKVQTRAIGGIQIVSGDYCRKHGYLDGSNKWQQPREDDVPFGDFRDDTKFRKELVNDFGYQMARIKDLPTLYRLRHSQTTYKGETVG